MKIKPTQIASYLYTNKFYKVPYENALEIGIELAEILNATKPPEEDRNADKDWFNETC